jgi:hypothetical protein
MSNVLICHAIKPRWPPGTGTSGAIFANSLLNSLLAGNCGRRKTRLFAPSAALLKNPQPLPAGLFHVKQNTNGTEIELVGRFGKTEGIVGAGLKRAPTERSISGPTNLVEARH